MLVERGVVLKSASEADARGVVLTLTRSGKPLWKRVMQLIERRNADIFGGLSRNEQKQLETLFDRLIARAEGFGAGPT
jgi:DNA-binding MarR family transcriptional regulator